MVIHPILHRNYLVDSKLYIFMAAGWIYGCLFKVTMAASTSAVKDGVCYFMKFWVSKTAAKAYGVLSFCLIMVIPICIMVYCYAKVVIVLRHRVAITSSTSLDNNTTMSQKGKNSNLTNNKVQYNIIKTLVIVSCVYILCWIWNQVFFLLLTLGYITRLNTPFYHFSQIAVFLNSVFNPVVYSAHYKPFQTGFKKIFLKSSTNSSIGSTN